MLQCNQYRESNWIIAMKKEKNNYLYLNRTVMLIVMVGYSSFLVLMLLMDWYLIRKYKNLWWNTVMLMNFGKP